MMLAFDGRVVTARGDSGGAGTGSATMRRTCLLGLFVAAAAAGCAPSPEELRDRGIEALQVGHLDEADELLTLSLDREPADPRTLYYRGRLAHLRGHLPQAMYYYQCSLDADPSRAGAREALAEVEAELGPAAAPLRFIP
jgi:hypothetical protein